MISYSEARYIVTEISRIGFYQETVAKYRSKIEDLDREKDALTMPSSPNGKESIGDAKGNEVWDYTKALLEIVSKQDELRDEMLDYWRLLKRAERYLERLNESLESDYVKDYFKTHDKRQLQRKYHVGNAYDKIIRITRSVVTKI